MAQGPKAAAVAHCGSGRRPPHVHIYIYDVYTHVNIHICIYTCMCTCVYEHTLLLAQVAGFIEFKDTLSCSQQDGRLKSVRPRVEALIARAMQIKQEEPESINHEHYLEWACELVQVVG